jgi:hypothetical protein
MKRRCIWTALLVTCVLCTCTASWAEPPRLKRLVRFAWENPYRDRSIFVEIPAKVGSIVGNTVGYAVGVPVGIFAPKISGDGIRRGFRRLGAYVVGAPFYYTKQYVWQPPIDYVRRAYRGVASEFKGSKKKK